MIALALSSVIMLALVQANRNAAHLLHEAQSLLVVNRQVALLYNQLERDITGSTPYEKRVPYKPAKLNDKKNENDAPVSPEDKKEAENKAVPDSSRPTAELPGEKNKKEKEVFVPSCTLEPFEEGVYRVGDKKWQQTKKLSFITTTPLEVYEQEHERMVRVGYELVYDKKISTPQKSVYTLYRLQTDELENVTFKEDEQKKTLPVSRYVVANYIKQFSLEASYDKRPASGAENKSAPVATEEAQEQVKVFAWGEQEEKEKSKTVLPDQFLAHIEVWDGAINRSYSFTCVLPIFVKTEAKKEIKKPESPVVDGEKTGAVNTAQLEAAQKSAAPVATTQEGVHEQNA